LRKYCDENINLDGIESPVVVNSRIYKKIMNQNDFSFNVYACETNEEYNETVKKTEDKKKPFIYPLFISSEMKAKHINLFYISQLDENGETISHYTYITDMSRLLASLSKHQHKMHTCLKCLHRFSREDLLTRHTHDNLCTKKSGPIRCVFPKGGDDSEIVFKHVSRQLRIPFKIVADFEALTTEYNNLRADTDGNTTRYQKHIASSVGLKVVSEFEDLIYYKPEIIRADTNVTTYFLNRLFELEKEINEIMKTNKPMVMTKQDWIIHNTATECHICKHPFTGHEKKVRDHCHITGKYRGPAHNSCNLNYKQNTDFKIPVFIHNSKGYDTHLIMQAISQFSDKKIKCIPKTEEKLHASQ